MDVEARATSSQSNDRGSATDPDTNEDGIPHTHRLSKTFPDSLSDTPRVTFSRPGCSPTAAGKVKQRRSLSLRHWQQVKSRLPLRLLPSRRENPTRERGSIPLTNERSGCRVSPLQGVWWVRISAPLK